MAGYSYVNIVGNLTRDPELRYIPSGAAVCDITLAVTEREKKAGEWVDTTAFIDCTLWAKTAEIAAQYLTKGSQAMCAGSIRQENWEKDGQKRSKLKVVVDKLQLLGTKSDRPAQVAQPAGVAEDEDPFGF
jgi:single-strand DNA-binding protein